MSLVPFRRAAEPGASTEEAWRAGLAAERAGRPAEAAAHWLRAARAGHPGAASALARLYEEGRGVAASPDQAARWWRVAAEAGEPEALARLATLHLAGLASGDPTRPGAGRSDPERARSLARRAAEAGHPAGQALLGYLLAAGIGGPSDAIEAERWYRAAAAAGEPAAWLGLGVLLLAPSRPAEAAAEGRLWLTRAAEAGTPTAAYALGLAHEHGRGGPVSIEAALVCYERAARKGHGLATVRLARLLRRARWPSAALPALDLLRAAARAGLVEAMVELAEALGAEEGPEADPEEAARWCRAAAERGHRGAQRALADLYLSGRGVPADPGLAAHWLARAAGAGDGEAARELVRVLEGGAGVAHEPDVVRAWFELAGELGDATAAFLAGVAHATGRLGSVDLAAAARSWRRAAELGHGLAAVNLARLTMAGAGVERDPEAAERLLLEAAARSEPHAPAALAELYGLFWPEPDPNRAAAWLDRARASGDRVAEVVAGRLARAGQSAARSTIGAGTPGRTEAVADNPAC